MNVPTLALSSNINRLRYIHLDEFGVKLPTKTKTKTNTKTNHASYSRLTSKNNRLVHPWFDETERFLEIFVFHCECSHLFLSVPFVTQFEPGRHHHSSITSRVYDRKE